MSEITEEQQLLYTAQTGNSAHSNAVTKNNVTVITQITANNKTWDYTIKL